MKKIVLSTIAANYGYPTVVGVVLVGGIFEGTLGLFAKYWRKIISPIVAASVVTAIGLSLFSPPPIQRRQPVQAEVVEEEEGEAEGGGGPEEGGGGG